MTTMAEKEDLAFLISKDWAEIIDENKDVPLQSGEMTARMMAKETDKSRHHCSDVLARMYHSGKATRRSIIQSGIKMYAYRLKK